MFVVWVSDFLWVEELGNRQLVDFQTVVSSIVKMKTRFRMCINESLSEDSKGFLNTTSLGDRKIFRNFISRLLESCDEKDTL